MKLKEAIQLINSYDFNEIAEFQDGVMQEAIDTVLAELEKQKQVKWEEGYNQGYLAGAMEQI